MKLNKVDNKKRFLELYRTPESGGNISIVCAAVGIGRATYYKWIENDEKFRDAMYEMKMEKCDEMEQVLYKRGRDKSDVALIYWLKNNHPDYKEQGNTTNIQVNVQPILGGKTKE